MAVFSPWAYLAAYLVLVSLTVGTVALSFARLGAWHLAVGGAIAAVKAAIVALVFMHLARSPGRTWLAAFLGLFWLCVLLALTFSDYLTRPEAAL